MRSANSVVGASPTAIVPRHHNIGTLDEHIVTAVEDCTMVCHIGIKHHIGRGYNAVVEHLIAHTETQGKGWKWHYRLYHDIFVPLAESHYSSPCSEVEALGHTDTKGANTLIVERLYSLTQCLIGLTLIGAVAGEGGY